LELEDILKKDRNFSVKDIFVPNREPITFAQMTCNFEGTKKCLEQVLPYVDRAIIVTGELTDEEIKALEDMDEKVHVFWHEWEDNFSKQRNNYIKEIKKMGKPYGWVLVTDHDEVLSEEACKLLRPVVDQSNEGQNYSVVKINSYDITYDNLGNKVHENQSDWYKDLLFKVWHTTHYVGNHHEGLRTIITGIIKMPKSAPYYHIKTFEHIIRRGIENFWIGGGGANIGKNNPIWVELKDICKKLGLNSFNEFENYLKEGNIDKSLSDWMIKYRNHDEMPWVDSELRSFFIYYYYYLHPEERPEGIESKYLNYAPKETDTGIVSRLDDKEGEIQIA